MARKRRRPAPESRDVVEPVATATIEPCWLCRRPLGRKIEWHHPRPKSKGGRQTVAVHPICHRAIHASFSNAELARGASEGVRLADTPEMARFLAWIAGKPPDFHAPTRSHKPRAGSRRG